MCNNMCKLFDNVTVFSFFLFDIEHARDYYLFMTSTKWDEYSHNDVQILFQMNSVENVL